MLYYIIRKPVRLNGLRTRIYIAMDNASNGAVVMCDPFPEQPATLNVESSEYASY